MGWNTVALRILPLFWLLANCCGGYSTGHEPNNASDSKPPKLGWTSQPNGRGTLDIIWSCLLTLFLCCWSLLCANVPQPGDGYIKSSLRKIWLMLLCALAPELILLVSIGQLVSARRSVKLFHESGYEDWSLVHGFYVDMGGLVLETEGWKSFPIDARQLHYLVTKGYVEYPRISKSSIRDRNKCDGMFRVITVVQTLWFCVNLALRAAQGLTITSLELSTSAYVFCGAATALCWRCKPADINTSEVIRSHTPIADILRDGGDQAKELYNRTPLDFISREEWEFSIVWAHGLQLLRNLGLASQPTTRPIQRFQNTIVPKITGVPYAYFVAVSFIYLSIFMLGWNYSFPTPVEQVLWRAASLTALLSAFVLGIVSEFSFVWWPKMVQYLPRIIGGQAEQQRSDDNTMNQATPERSEKDLEKGSIVRKKLERWAATFRNNSAMKDSQLYAPLKVILGTWILGVFYCSSRAYLWVGEFTELRLLPRSAYQTVDWTWIIPHF